MNVFNREKEADPVRFKCLVHAFTVLLAYYKLETDLRIEERLEALEKLQESHGLRK